MDLTHHRHEVSVMPEDIGRKACLVGGYAALGSFLLTLFDIIFGSLTSGNLTTLPQTAVERFAEFQGSMLMGLYHLDFLNAVNTLVMVPVTLALLFVHRKKGLLPAAFAASLSLIGTAVFLSANAALPMLELSGRYHAASDDAQRVVLAGAGEALLAKGAHGSLGAFPGFFLLTLATFSMAVVLLNGKVFTKRVAYLGILGNALLLVYLLLVTFVPSLQGIAVIMAAPGGIMALVWLLFVGMRLIRMGREAGLR